MSTRLHSLLLIVIAALVLLPGAASAWELRLTNDGYDQQYPAISGTNVVWQDDRNGNWDIYLYDAATGQTRRLTTDSNDQEHPQIAGHYVVWEDYRNSVRQKENPDIYKLDLDTGEEGIVNSPDAAIFGGYECNPAIDDTNGVVVVAWVETAAGISEQARVFYRYIDGTGLPRQANSNQSANLEGSPWVSDQKVVWTDGQLGGVYFHHVKYPNDYSYVFEQNPDITIKGLRISGDRIVWSQYDTTKWVDNIRVFRLNPDLTTGIGSWVSPRDSFQTDPAIDGTLLVWSDERNANTDSDIYLYDFTANAERPLVVASGKQYQTTIDGELVAFTDSRSGSNEIYLVPARTTTPLPGAGVVAFPGTTALPRDLDANGKYEDVNGNGRKDFADVVLYFNQMAWITANEPVAAFDYNANTRIDFADVVWLFNHL